MHELWQVKGIVMLTARGSKSMACIINFCSAAVCRCFTPLPSQVPQTTLVAALRQSHDDSQGASKGRSHPHQPGHILRLQR